MPQGLVKLAPIPALQKVGSDKVGHIIFPNLFISNRFYFDHIFTILAISSASPNFILGWVGKLTTLLHTSSATGQLPASYPDTSWLTSGVTGNRYQSPHIHPLFLALAKISQGLSTKTGYRRCTTSSAKFTPKASAYT